MRKLVLLVCIAAVSVPLAPVSPVADQIIPSWESASKQFGFFPISNEVSFYRNVDDSGEDRGETIQVISINAFRIWTEFSFEMTGDFNWNYAPGFSRDHYVELSLVKPVTSYLSLNVQRIIATFEEEPVNQVGLRLKL